MRIADVDNVKCIFWMNKFVYFLLYLTLGVKKNDRDMKTKPRRQGVVVVLLNWKIFRQVDWRMLVGSNISSRYTCQFKRISRLRKREKRSFLENMNIVKLNICKTISVYICKLLYSWILRIDLSSMWWTMSMSHLEFQ